MNQNQIYFVFDVESLGLLGVGFAYGFAVVDSMGKELSCGYGAIEPKPEEIPEWVKENVLPALWGWSFPLGWASPLPCDDSKPQSAYLQEYARWQSFRNAFWLQWEIWREQGAVMVSDVAFPVETQFLAMCIGDNVERSEKSPYPLLDVSSVLMAAGKDPVGSFERLAGETPVHNPLADARQSARILIETLRELEARDEFQERKIYTIEPTKEHLQKMHGKPVLDEVTQ